VKKIREGWRAEPYISRLVRHFGAVGLTVACFAIAPHATLGQTYLARNGGSTANAADRPSPNTPIPSYYAASYRVYQKLKAAAYGGTQYARTSYGKMPDWSGLWTSAPGDGLKFDPKQQGSGFGGPLGPITAHLTPRYRAAYEAKLRNIAAGNEWDQLSDCLPAGYPRFLTEPFLREFIVTPQETWWINEQQSEARRIYTDGRGHVPDDAAQTLWDGDSIGFWDGDTLVVHTIRVTHGEYQRNQPDYSSQTSTVERIRMVDANTIVDDVTVWDPKGLEQPWHVIRHYVRVNDPGSRIDMWSCEQNNNVVRTASGGTQFILKGETVAVKRGYKDPNTFYLSEVQKKLFGEDEAENDSK
jgi:hypothetical protein